ncbi:hypothetical protein AQ505_12235 [Pedobacter sp. PACM 27299]|uniref:hypothetical protein n=1 Tax=Pedobacter sp. PACM 27299 TaxID=1727164 RepID=UPI000706604C|nr:hypothetical protein [Pedobacter sp. PACM 27299]ALL06190.1 hypothetical protein AQ505_12235 [Pedobacter sp. PACM 27299]
MNTHLEKEQLTKVFSASNDHLQMKRKDQPTFQFVDNRPQVMDQISRQEMANNSLQVRSSAQLKVIQRQGLAHHPIQLTKGRNKYLDKSRDPKRKLTHKRSLTAYGKLNKFGKSHQGPHRISHVTTSVMIDVAQQQNRKLSSLLNSKIIMRPRINNHILREGLRQKGAQPMTALLRERKIAYLTRYKRLYAKAQRGDEKAAAQLIEMQALQTYKWVEGAATPAEMAGKGERRGVAADDLEKARHLKKGEELPAGLKTVDTSGMNKPEKKMQAGRFRQYGRVVDNEALSDAESVGSESDSDVEMEE